MKIPATVTTSDVSRNRHPRSAITSHRSRIEGPQETRPDALDALGALSVEIDITEPKNGARNENYEESHQGEEPDHRSQPFREAVIEPVSKPLLHRHVASQGTLLIVVIVGHHIPLIDVSRSWWRSHSESSRSSSVRYREGDFVRYHVVSGLCGLEFGRPFPP